MKQQQIESVSSDQASCSITLLEKENPPEVDGNTSHNAASDSENGINSRNSQEGKQLLSAARAGDLRAIKEIFENGTNVPLTGTDEYKYSRLCLAAMSGSADRVKILIENGADLLVQNKNRCTALYMILNNIPNGEDLLIEILNKYIEMPESTDGKEEELKVSLKVLCPKDKNKMAVADWLYTSHTQNKNLLRHPLLKTLIHLKWKEYQYFMWYRAIIFFLYLLLLTVFAFYQDGDNTTLKGSLLGPLSVHLIIFCFPYFIPGGCSWKRRISKISLFAVPPFLTLVSVSIPYNTEWCGISYLFSWLSVPLYCTSFPVVSHQAGMFIFVTREVFKHSVLFFFVLAGFSITFYVLYHDISSENYKNFGYTFLYTSLVLLQGDSLGDYHKIRGNNTADTTINNGYVTYVTEALSTLRFASVITSLLFVLLVIIALLNMLVALAVRGGNELQEYGQVYHLWNQTQLLYEWYEVKKFLPKCFSKGQLEHSKDKITIKKGDIPRSVRTELTYLAKCNGEKKGLNPLINELEEVVKKKISALICQIHDLKVQ
jgi:hypothetical protein